MSEEQDDTTRHTADTASEGYKDALKLRSQLIECAAILVRGSYTVTDDPADYKVKVPTSVLHQISKQNERLVNLGRRIKEAADALCALTRPATAPLAEQPDAGAMLFKDLKPEEMYEIARTLGGMSIQEKRGTWQPWWGKFCRIMQPVMDEAHKAAQAMEEKVI